MGRLLLHLEGLHERPQQNANGVALPKQFDEPGGSEQPQEAQVNHLVLEVMNGNGEKGFTAKQPEDKRLSFHWSSAHNLHATENNTQQINGTVVDPE